MNIIKKLFSFMNEENCAIGLCKFNDDFFRTNDSKNKIKEKINKNVNLTQMLRKSV